MSTGAPLQANLATFPSYGDARAAEAQLMREFLARLKPLSGSEALRALREAFPAASLAARVEAMAHHAGEA